SLRSRDGSGPLAGSDDPGPKEAAPAAGPSPSSGGGEAAAVLLVLRIREVPVSRRARVSLAIGSILLKQAEMLISSSPEGTTGPQARPPRRAGLSCRVDVNERRSSRRSVSRTRRTTPPARPPYATRRKGVRFRALGDQGLPRW